MKKKWLLIGVIVVVGIFLIWRGRQAGQTKITTVNPQVRDIVQVLKVSGKVDAAEKVRMSFAGASKLTWLPVKEGDRVKKWQGLAQVDARTLKNSMEIAMNTHGKTFRAYENTLDGIDYYSDAGLTEAERRTAENAQLDIRSSALAVESADVAVKLAYMSSPIEGVVTKIDQKNVGALMLPTDAIEIVNPMSIFFSAVVDEEDIVKITASQAANIRLDAFDDQEFESAISRVAFVPSISENGGTGYQVWLKLPVNNNQMTYRLGMNGEADIVLDKKPGVLTVPVDALIEREGKQYVEVERLGKSEKVEVTTGIDDGDYIEVKSGLTTADKVIVP